MKFVEKNVNLEPSYAELHRQVKDLEDEKKRIATEVFSGHAQTEEKFKAILDTVDVHMSLVDRDLNIIWANRRTKEIFGSDIVGRSCSKGCYGGEQPCAESSKCIVKKAFRSGTVEEHETQTTGQDGQKVYFSGKAKVVQFDNDGFPAAVVKVYSDITEQKKAELELKRSLEQLRKNLAGTIQAMAMTVETRDPYTAGHQRRTSDIARSIGLEMGLTSEQVDGIRMAGVVHDLGKISIPAAILSKPGKIGSTEYALIKDHPQTGYSILKGIDFQWPVAEIVRQHHERMDGSGYPYGLHGDKIMLEAKIIGVADVIEAMSSHRPYRPSLGAAKAFDEIKMNSGTLYDPEVVNATVNLFNRGELDFN